MNALSILGAILILSFTALNTQRHQTDIRQTHLRSEVELRATGLATRLLDHLGTLPFDENAEAASASDLTPADGFGGAASFSAATDLDDVDGLSFVTTIAAAEAPLPFEVDLTVRYVEFADDTFVPSADRTPFKEVTVQLAGEADAVLTVQRVYAMQR